MVDTGGQLYTIEGIAAGILMITTAYLVLSTTTIFTFGDTHISDMQLEQLGNDALAMMDFAPTFGGSSELEWYITQNDTTAFNNFNTSLMQKLNPTYTGQDSLKYSAAVYYNTNTDPSVVKNYSFTKNNAAIVTGREHMVRVTRFIHLNQTPMSNPPADMKPNQMVLLEVLLWRD